MHEAAQHFYLVRHGIARFGKFLYELSIFLGEFIDMHDSLVDLLDTI